LIGFVNRGKSTLLNALLGNKKEYNISPVRLLPCTAAIVKYFDSALHPDGEGKEGAFIHFNDGREVYIDKKEIPMYVDQKAEGFSEDRAQRIDCIDVYGSYPLIEKRGVIVDTPGMGAVYDQDYLVDRILPDVDIILSPTAADYSGANVEKEFIKDKLRKSEQEKLMFLITKIDSENINEDDLRKVSSDVQEFAASFLDETPPVYKIAAKKVLEAYKEKKSDAEIAAVKEKWGIKELEKALDARLRETSIAENRMRRICEELEFDFDIYRKKWAEQKENLSLKTEDLEQKKIKLEAECKIIKDSFEKGTKELERNWNKKVDRFVRRLDGRESDISERLSKAVENANLLSLIGFQKKMEREIQSILQRELRPELDDLQDGLVKIVEEFNVKFKSDIENDPVYAKYKTTGSAGGDINTLIGGGIVAAGGLWGTSTALGAVNVISAAAADAVAASGALEAVKAGAGALNWIRKGLTGTGAITEAAKAAAAAKAALFSTVVSSIVPMIAGIAVPMLAYNIGTRYAKSKAEKSIPKMIETQLQDVAKSVGESSQQMLTYVLKDVTDHVETELTKKQDELAKTIEEVNNHKKAKAQKGELERNLRELEKLSKDLIILNNES
jgi:GTPase Era involved in 16S rRNA processing